MEFIRDEAWNYANLILRISPSIELSDHLTLTFLLFEFVQPSLHILAAKFFLHPAVSMINNLLAPLANVHNAYGKQK